MHERFRETLENYNTYAIAELDDERTTEELARLRDATIWRMERAAERTLTPMQTQEQIFALQEEKQTIMERLLGDLAALDAPKEETERPSGGRRVTKRESGFVAERNDGSEEAVTVGELMTDGDWGIEYALDAATVDRTVRKRYLITQAHRRIKALLDRQIILQESTSDATRSTKRAAYERIGKDREAGTLHAGLVAEQMVRNLLKKLTFDGGATFEVLDVDVYQDMEQKIDFLIRRKTHHRGVQVESDEHTETVGVQFTTNTREDILREKQKQVARAKEHRRQEEHLDDIVLVSVPLHSTMDLYRAWSKDRRAGGPEKLWDAQTKTTILREVMKGVLDPEEIEAVAERSQTK